MSVYIDFITLAWAVIVLVLYSNWLVKSWSMLAGLGVALTGTYLIAQSGWTTAFLLGDLWGRDFSNYIWFIFNTLVFGLLTMLWKRHK